MLQFVHSTVSRQPRIKHCVLLSPTPRISFESLLVYEKFAEIIYVEVKDSSYDFKTIQTIPVETPLRWIDSCNEYLFSFTETNKLIISHNPHFNSSLSKISSLDFSISLEPSGRPENFQFFCFSRSKNFLVISSKTNHFFVIDISDLFNLEMEPFFFEEDFTIVDITFSPEQNGFIFLVEINEANPPNDEQAEQGNQNLNENEPQNHEENQNEGDNLSTNIRSENEEYENEENDNEKSEDKDEEEDNDNDNVTENDNENESDNEENESDADEEESDDDKSKKSKKRRSQQASKAQNQKKHSQQKKTHQKKSQNQKNNENKKQKKIKSNQKFIFFDAKTFSITKADPVYEDFIMFLPTNDTSRSFSFVRENAIEINSKQQININSPVRIISKINLGIFACQLESNEIVLVGSDFKAPLFISEAPKLENIYILSNTVILLASQEKNYYIELHKIKRILSKKGSSAKNIQFKSLKSNKTYPIIKEINLNPIPTFSEELTFPKDVFLNSSSLYFNNKESKLLFSTDSGIYHLSSDVHIETGKSKCKVDDMTDIFAPVSDVVLASNGRESRVVYGEAEISKKPTIAVLYFASKHIQVHKDGIDEINDETLYESKSNKIKCAASNGIRLIVGHEDGRIILFHGSFNEFDEMNIPNLINLAICGTHFAVLEPSKVSLYDFALQNFAEYSIPSYPVSMVFLNNGRELYISLHCGAIMKISENTVSYPCYFNKDPKILQTKECESALFVLDEYLYIYLHSRLIKTDLTNITAICASYDEDEPLVLNICFLQNEDKHKRLFIIKFDEITYSYKLNKIDYKYTNPKLFEFCGNLYAFTEYYNEEDDTQSSIIIDFESKETLIQIPEKITCYTINEDHGYLFLAAGNTIYCFNYYDNTLNTKFKVELENKPIALGSFYNSISIGFSNCIKIADFQEDSLKFHNISLDLVSPLKSIISNGFCWAILDNSTIFTYIFNYKLDQFEIICYGHYNYITFSQFCIIDSRTIAAVADKTNIYFFRTPERLSTSSIGKHSLDVIGKYNAFQEILTLKIVGDAIIYVTVDGSVHSLTCCNQDTRYRIMIANQLKIRTEILNLFAFSEPSDDVICNQYNVVDGDLLDTFKNQNHNVKNEQDIMDSIFMIERQKILFK